MFLAFFSGAYTPAVTFYCIGIILSGINIYLLCNFLKKESCFVFRLVPFHYSIWSNPPGSAGDRRSRPLRATRTASTPARRLRATPTVTKSTVLLLSHHPGPPHSPTPRPRTSLPPSKAPTVPLCRTTLSDTL